MRMDELSGNFTRLVADTSRVFREMDYIDWSRSREDGGWTRQEILGHLIDSAANNHQRFVRAMAFGDLIWPGYDQEAMVRVQQFGLATPSMLIALWESFNLFLARLFALIPEERLAAQCQIGGDPPVSLEFLVFDYVAHHQHHLRQIFVGMDAGVRWVDLPN